MRRWLKTKIRKKAIVYTVEGKSLEGWLVDTDREGVVLNDVHLHADTMNQPVPMPGDVFVPRHQIEFVQIVRSGRREAA